MSDGISDGVNVTSADRTDGPGPGATTATTTVEAGGAVPPARHRRPNRFERPRPPHDWRWVVGGVGKTLITVGLLMFAFVAYQLWGTGIQTAQAQDRLEDRFEQVLATTTAPTTSEPTTTATSVAAATTTTIATVPVPAAAPAPGDPVAQLEIPAIDVDLIVVEGVGRGELQKGPGHFPETPMPGQLGNSAIAGHRTTFGAPFYDIDQLEAGDDIIVTTATGRFVYLVTGQKIVKPSEYAEVIPTVDPTKATLTLTSCHPIRSAAKRIVISAELDPTRSAATVAPTVTSTPEPTETTQTSPGTTAASTDTIASSPDTEPAAVIPGDDDPTLTNHDAFGDGWFSDSTAWPHVLVWGFALLAVSLAARLVMRRTRRYWPGLVAGAVPFVVVLYFWFENVNRLLPPNL